MTRRLRIGAIATLFVVGLAVPAEATDGSVTFRYPAYSPSNVRITPGGTVTFTPDSGNSFEAGDYSYGHPLTFVDPTVGNVTSGTAATPKTFATPGVYQFYCAHHGYLNPDGTVGGMSGRIVVTNNQPPTASFTETPATASAGQPVTLDASASTDDGAISSYKWDFNNDGTIDETDTQPMTTHTFTTTSTVRLTVVDNNADAVGPESTSATQTVTIPGTPAPPPAGGTPGTGGPGTGGPGPASNAADHTAPHISLVTHSLHLSDLRAGRARLTFTSSEAGGARATLKAGSTTIAIGSVTYTKGGRHSLSLRLTEKGVTKLRHAKRLSVRLTLLVRDAAGNHTSASRLLSRVR